MFGYHAGCRSRETRLPPCLAFRLSHPLKGGSFKDKGHKREQKGEWICTEKENYYYYRKAYAERKNSYSEAG